MPDYLMNTNSSLFNKEEFKQLQQQPDMILKQPLASQEESKY